MLWVIASASAGDGRTEVAASLTSTHGHTHQEPVGVAPLPADYGTPAVGFSGLRLQGSADLVELKGGWLSLVGQADLRLEFHEVGDDRESRVGEDALVGARWRPVWEPALVPDVTLGFGTASLVAFRGSAELPEAFTATRFGVSPGVGVSFPLGGAVGGLLRGPLDLRVDGALLFAPLPVEGRLSVACDLWELGPVRPRVGLDLDRRGWKLDSGKLGQTRVVVAAGVSAPL